MKNWHSMAAAAALALGASCAHAQAFSGGLPAGWTCTGTCGALPAEGDVTLAPSGGTQYGFVATRVDGPTGVSPFDFGAETTGSRLVSTSFAAAAGDPVAFDFDYITSDGAGYADYAWARLVRASDDSQVALLFTARTKPSGSIIPGQGLPMPEATIFPTDVPIISGPPSWSGLGGDSGNCFDGGCGQTGWVDSSYTLPESGTFRLEFGVVNWGDAEFQSGMAFDGITVAGVPITPAVPEPQTYTLLLGGLGLLGVATRRRSRG